MNVASQRLGDLDATAENTIEFPDGLPGFDGKQFIRVDVGSGFEWLQSTADAAVCILTAAPESLHIEYEPKPKRGELKTIFPDSEIGEFQTRVIIRRDPEAEGWTLNLFAPVVINQADGLAMQVPLVGSGYSTNESWAGR